MGGTQFLVRRLEPLLELELLLGDEPFDELPLEELPERDTPEDVDPLDLPELEERREVLVELLLEPRELERLLSLLRRETPLLSELSRFEVRRSVEVEGCRVSVGASREPAGRATEVPPAFGILTTSPERESVSVLAPRRAERRPSLVRFTASVSVRVSLGESATVRRVRR